MPKTTLQTEVVGSLADVEAAQWDICANPPRRDGAGGETYNPFLSHAFLLALEKSKSVGARSGWTPAHVLVKCADAGLVAAAPAYLKTQSLGEYVFDQAWARAFEHAGGRYYPKIQVAVPFTPVTGNRLLVAPHAPDDARDALIAALRSLRDAHDASSIHVTFPTSDDTRALAEAGFTLRTGEQFHFINENYRCYDDFLATMVARKRKAIKRERREAAGDDLTIERLTGGAIMERHWDAFFAFYADTGARKWGRPYLTRAFFDEIGTTMADRILLVMARRGDEPIAGAINFLGDEAIYGRHWGALEARPFLHFEVCYHQAIEFAIERGYKRVEAGAQGDHKLARGYRPVATYSAHEFADRELAAAIEAYLVCERRAVAERIAESETMLPFRSADES